MAACCSAAQLLSESPGYFSTDNVSENLNKKRDTGNKSRDNDSGYIPISTYSENNASVEQCYDLVTHGDINVCHLNRTRTAIGKVLYAQCFESWERYTVVLENSKISTEETTIPYSIVDDVDIISHWITGKTLCIRVRIPDGSLLLRADNAYERDQWVHSIEWKMHMYKYEELFKNATAPDVLVQYIKDMIRVSFGTPIQDPSVYTFPLDLICGLLQKKGDVITGDVRQDIIAALTPLLEDKPLKGEICSYFSEHSQNSPRSSILLEIFTPVVQRILRKVTDFGKCLKWRELIQQYILTLNSQNAETNAVKDFIETMHSPASRCPHPRVLPNLVSVCIDAISSFYQEMNVERQFEHDIWEKKVICFISIMETISAFDDWRYSLGRLLQSVPFPSNALVHSTFTSHMKHMVRNIASDSICDVHQTIHGIREGKDGWFDLYCPGHVACDDDGELWGVMLRTLMRCSCRTIKFLEGMNEMLNPLMLLALQENQASLEVLCAMLELDLIKNDSSKGKIVTTLQATTTGKRMYAELCDRQLALRKLLQEGGPTNLTLPAKSTDAALAKALSSGFFGNLEELNLAYTHVTSACADELVKLPSLRILNLCSTRVGDAGLQKISQHLHKLEELNLSQTPVTDKGISSIKALKKMRKLNLNSTSVSRLAFLELMEQLPVLKECDLTYTDAIYPGLIPDYLLT